MTISGIIVYIHFLIFFQLEHAERQGNPNVSLGLADSDDILLTRWNGSIIGPQNVRSITFDITNDNILDEKLSVQNITLKN